MDASGWRRLELALVALLGLMMLPACGAGGSENGGGSASNVDLSGAEADARMASYRELVREQTRVAGRAMANAVDGELRFAVGRNALCTDDGAGWAYDSSGRIDPPPEAERPFRDPAAEALKKLGYQVEDRAESSGDGRLIADKGKAVVTVYEDAGGPALLFSVASPCMIVPEEQRDEYPKPEPSPDIVPNRM